MTQKMIQALTLHLYQAMFLSKIQALKMTMALLRETKVQAQKQLNQSQQVCNLKSQKLTKMLKVNKVQVKGSKSHQD
jgi:hypothetical protein